MRFTVLGSGSTGNAVLISSERTNVLVDAGLSAREILRRLAAVGVDPDELDGVLITHEHSDHAGGLRVLPAPDIVAALHHLVDIAEDRVREPAPLQLAGRAGSAVSRLDCPDPIRASATTAPFLDADQHPPERCR